MMEELQDIRHNPENVVWSEPHLVILKKNDEDNLGVKVKTCQGRINSEDSYTLVTQVRQKCSEQRRDKLNAGYRIIAGNGINITRMSQDQVLKTLTNYNNGEMRLLVSYPLRLRDNVHMSAPIDNILEKGNPRDSLDNQVSGLVRANLQRCRSSESEHSVSLKSMSDGPEQIKHEQHTSNMSSPHHTSRERADRDYKGAGCKLDSKQLNSKSGYQKHMTMLEAGEADIDMHFPRHNPLIQQIASGYGSPSKSSHSLPISRTSMGSPIRSTSLLRSPMQKSHSLSTTDELYDITLEEPHLIVWSTPSKGIEIRRDSDGKLGFRYKEVQNKEDPREVFTLVKEVFANSPALGHLRKGDRILSVNGQHLQDTRRGINTASIVSKSQEDKVRVVIQRPMSLRERKPVTTTDIVIDVANSTESASMRASPRNITRSASKSHQLTSYTAEGKKRPHSGSSSSQGNSTSNSYTSRPIHVQEVTYQTGQQHVDDIPHTLQHTTITPTIRPNFLPCENQYNPQIAPQNGLHTTYHMNDYVDHSRMDSLDNPVLVSMATEAIDITIRSGHPMTNGMKKACSVQLNIAPSPHVSPAHTPTKAEVIPMETIPPLSTPTPTANGCTCLARWNIPLKDSFKKISGKTKCESARRPATESQEVNRNVEKTSYGNEKLQNKENKQNYKCDSENNADRGVGTQSTKVCMETHIRKLPCGLLSIICQYMNVKTHTGMRDWRGLADEMGKTIEDIYVLEQTDDPCKALLKDWGTQSNATLGRLLQMLQNSKLMREDVVSEINKYLSLS
ncbi:uncharacterized protein LOC144438711 isoform X1 [Glandiceps talaboti]